MTNEELSQYAKTIPPNLFSSGTIFGIPIRRYIEGLIFVLIIGFMCYISPFVFRIKVILISVLCTAVFTFSLLGIKNRSITEFFYDITLFNRSKRNTIWQALKKIAGQIQLSLNSVQNQKRKNYSI